jgi:protein arginine kinase activator
MTCQKCRSEATVHLTENVNGTLRETHLCTRCARKAGVVASGPAPEFGLDEVLQKLITANVGELVGDLARRSCPDCGLRFMEFRVEGRLGCPADYEAFGPGLLPMLRKAQGASRHVGKVPARGQRPGARLRLRAELRDAVAREDYEAAARLRDRLRQEGSDR